MQHLDDPTSDSLGCGRCAYPIRGLDSTVCPECGADRDVVGVRRLDRRWTARRRLVIACLSWTIAFGALLALAWPWLLAATPRPLSNHRDYVLRPTDDRYAPLTLRRIGYGWGWRGWQGPAIAPRQCVLNPEMHRGEGAMTRLSFELASGHASYAAARFDGLKVVPLPSWSGTLDEATLVRWLVLVGAPESDAAADAADLLALMRKPAFDADDAGRLTRFAATTTGGVEIVPAYHGRPLLIGVATVVWLIGLTSIVAITRRRTAAISSAG